METNLDRTGKAADESARRFVFRRWQIAFGLIALIGAGFALAVFFPPSSDLSPTTISEVASSFKTESVGTRGDGQIETHRAASLSDLLPGIEAKVAANPSDFDLRLLLAQTYLELEQDEKAAVQLKMLRKQAPKNPQVALLLARATVDRSSKRELRVLLRTLAPIAKSHPQLAAEAHTVQGQAHARLGDREAARHEWMLALAELPPGDDRRGLIEMELAHLKR